MTEAMKKAITKPGTALSLILAAITLAALVAASAMMLPGTTVTEPTADQLGVALYQVGLDPEAITAAGVREGQVATLVTEAEAALTSRLGALVPAEANLAAANQQAARLRRDIRAGVADENASASLATAQSNADAARAAIAAIHNAVFEAATDHLDPAVVIRLQTIAANRLWDLPIQYAVDNRTESQWKSLREALANIRICNDSGEDPDNACTALVSEQNADPDIAQASTFLDSRLANITNAFQQSLNH